MIQLLHDLQARGVRLRLKGEDIEFVAPKGAMTPDLLTELRGHKPELRNYLLLRDGRGGLGGSDPRTCLLPLQHGGGRTPLFLAHPAGGMAFCYKDLARHLGPRQPLYGLSSPGWTGEPPDTVEAMAATYVRAVRSVQPKGPYRLGAWSLGGLTAWDMARQLAAEGEETERLVLLDPAVPPDPDMHAFVVRVLGQLVRAFQHMLGFQVPDAERLAAAGDLDGFFASGLRAVDGATSALATPDLIVRCKQILLSHMNAFQVYAQDARVPVGRTLLLFTEVERMGRHLDWFRAHIDGPLEVRMLEQPHALMVFEPHVALVAEHVRGVLE